MVVVLINEGRIIQQVWKSKSLEAVTDERGSADDLLEIAVGWPGQIVGEDGQVNDPPPDPQPLQNITARQLRLALSKHHFLSQVEPALKAIPSDQAREEALIEWEYATEYQPNHPLVYIMIAEFGLTDEQFRVMWLAAMTL